MKRLQDKICFVTGGAAGMGAAIVRRFAAEGAIVAFGDIDEKRGREIANETGAEFHRQDVTDRERWQQIIADVSNRHGRFDVLVNNAGIALNSTIEDLDIEQWRRTFAINADGVFYGCHYAIAAMKKNPGGSSGSIVNIVSTSSMFGAASQVAYGPSKAAARLLTKSIALHCARAKLNIRCNAIHPGPTRTSITDQLLAEAEHPEELLVYLNNISPMGRMAEPSDIAAMALFLASDDSAYVSGADHVVDGSMSACHPGL